MNVQIKKRVFINSVPLKKIRLLRWGWGKKENRINSAITRRTEKMLLSTQYSSVFLRLADKRNTLNHTIVNVSCCCVGLAFACAYCLFLHTPKLEQRLIVIEAQLNNLNKKDEVTRENSIPLIDLSLCQVTHGTECSKNLDRSSHWRNVLKKEGQLDPSWHNHAPALTHFRKSTGDQVQAEPRQSLPAKTFKRSNQAETFGRKLKSKGTATEPIDFSDMPTLPRIIAFPRGKHGELAGRGTMHSAEVFSIKRSTIFKTSPLDQNIGVAQTDTGVSLPEKNQKSLASEDNVDGAGSTQDRSEMVERTTKIRLF